MHVMSQNQVQAPVGTGSFTVPSDKEKIAQVLQRMVAGQACWAPLKVVMCFNTVIFAVGGPFRLHLLLGETLMKIVR